MNYSYLGYFIRNPKIRYRSKSQIWNDVVENVNRVTYIDIRTKLGMVWTDGIIDPIIKEELWDQ